MKPASLYDYPALGGYFDKTVIVYDGECPFCTRFVEWQQLKDAVGPVTLLNAHDGGDLVSALWATGYDLNEGMVLIWNNQIFHGDDCVNRLALLSSGSGTFNRLNSIIFSSPRVSAFMYPILRTGRNAVLRLMGRKKITQR